jgi:hypothetical protein
LYGGLQLDGNIIIERNDENASVPFPSLLSHLDELFLTAKKSRFYGRPVKASQLLSGGAIPIPGAAFGLIAVIEAAEGKEVDTSDFPDDVDVAPSEQVPTPSEAAAAEQDGDGVHDDELAAGPSTPSTAPLPQRSGSPFDPDDDAEQIRYNRRHSADAPAVAASSSTGESDGPPSYKQQRDSLKARSTPTPPPLPQRRRPVSSMPSSPSAPAAGGGGGDEAYA